MLPYDHLNGVHPQRYRLRNRATGREVVVDARPGVAYLDGETGEPLAVTGALLPLGRSSSELPWAEEHLRLCPSCDQLVQRDLNYCPYDGRRLPPLNPPPPEELEPDEEPAS